MNHESLPHTKSQPQSAVVPTVFALAAFAVAIGGGLLAGNEPGTVLLRAIGAMVACQLVGMVAGAIVQNVLRQHNAERDAKASGVRNVDERGEPAQEAQNAAGV